MNWAWATSLEQIWRSPAFPMWLTLAAAGFFGIIVLVTVLRAEKSVANAALAVITLLAIGATIAATSRGFGPGDQPVPNGPSSLQTMKVALPALSCVDDLAGDIVLAGCEKALFGSAEAAAAAVSYAASQISRLTAFGNVAAADTSMTPELGVLRRAVEHDRYGLVAYVLVARDHCTPSDCAAFRSLTDSHKIVANMDARVYDGLISRYAPTWNAPPPARTGRGAYTGRAHGQTDQCRVSLRGLDPAGQHHDAGAGHRRDAVFAPAADRQCVSTVTAVHAHAGRGEKAGDAKTAAHALRPGFACTGCSSGTGSSSCRRE